MKFDSKQVVLLALAFAFILGITSARDPEETLPASTAVEAPRAS